MSGGDQGGGVPYGELPAPGTPRQTAPWAGPAVDNVYGQPAGQGVPGYPAPYPPAPYPPASYGYPPPGYGYGPGYPTGFPVPGYPAQGYPVPGYPAQGNGMGTAGFVLGLIALVLSITPLIGIVFGFLLAPFAIIFSAIGMGRQPKGLATAGLVLGIITIVLKSIPGINLI